MSIVSRLRRRVVALIPTGSLTEQTVKSGFWSLLNNVTGRALQLIKLIAVAHFLKPEDIGLLGIALLAIAVLEQFSKFNVDTALVHHPDENIDSYLNTAWTVKVLRGVAIGAILFLAAPLVAELFSTPRVTDVLRVLSLVPALNGALNPGIVYFRKDLEFHKEFFYRSSRTLTSVVVSVGIVLVYPSIWALVIGNLCGLVIKLIVSYLVHDHRPRPSFNFTKFRELFGYGKWVTLSTVVTFSLYQGDDAIVGVFAGASALGLYQVAYRLSNAPATEITDILSEVVFSMYSKVQDERDVVATGFLKILRLVSFVVAPIAVGIAAVSESFVHVALGEDWFSLISTLQILAIWGYIRSLSSSVHPLFNALSRPDINTKVNGFHLLLVGLFIVPVTKRFGTDGTAALLVIVSLLIIGPLKLYVAKQMLELQASSIIRPIAYPLICSLLMFGGVYLVGIILHPLGMLATLVGKMVVGVILYIAVTYVVAMLTGYYILDSLSEVYEKIR